MRRVFKCRVVSIQYNTIQTQYNTNSTQYNTIQFKCRAVTGPHHFCHRRWRKTWWRLPCSRKENTTLLHKHHPHLWNTTPLQTKTRNTKKHTKTNKVIMMPCSRKENTTPLPKSSSPLKNTKKYTKKTHLFQHHPYLHNTTNTQNATKTQTKTLKVWHQSSSCSSQSLPTMSHKPTFTDPGTKAMLSQSLLSLTVWHSTTAFTFDNWPCTKKNYMKLDNFPKISFTSTLCLSHVQFRD